MRSGLFRARVELLDGVHHAAEVVSLDIHLPGADMPQQLLVQLVSL